MKMVAFGVIGTSKAYLKVGWNILDCVVVSVSLICIIADNSPQLKALRALRTLRALPEPGTW